MKIAISVPLFILAALPALATDLPHELRARVLPTDPTESAITASWDLALEAVRKADRACDEKWLALKSREELQAYATELRGRFADAIGRLPDEKDKCPLNARTVATVQRDGYRVEKVLFESWTNVHVTANLFLPDSVEFKPPYPGLLISCGHSRNGKGKALYQRAGVNGAKAGFATLVFDPFGQGERLQYRNEDQGTHNRAGAISSLLGGGFARFFVWDCIRALDYLQSRPDIDGTRLGAGGISGGGCQTALLEALDGRVKAACPAGYITSYYVEASEASIGVGHSEQNTFNQLGLGINHASFVLMAMPNAVRVTANDHDEIFPFSGTLETMEVIAKTAARCGVADHYALATTTGLHCLTEGLQLATVDWMKRWLNGDVAALARGVDYSKFDENFCVPDADCGLVDTACIVTPQGEVRKLPGERLIFDLLRDDLDRALAARRGRWVTPREVMETAGMKEANFACVRREIGRWSVMHVRAFTVRETFTFPDGAVLPSVSIVPRKVRGTPVIIIGSNQRYQREAQVYKALAAGRPAVAVDLFACGEIGKERYLEYYRNEGQIATMLGVVGRTLPGVQAEELIGIARSIRERTGQVPDVVAVGQLAVAAAHAFAVERSAFGSITFEKPPKPWAQAAREADFIPFNTVVHGALLRYDWPELVESRGRNGAD